MPEMLVEITINKVQIGVRHDEDANVFVGYCPRFKVYSQGETKEDAREAVTSAIGLRLATAFEHGRIVKVLRDAGFERFVSGAASRALTPDDEFVAFKFNKNVEVTEMNIRVPIGALLHQRSIEECQP
jgi:predicted RNase H-like HicB family nuclease